MKKCILIFFVINLLIVSRTNSQIKIENSLLWEISGNGLKNSSYLFGTHHRVSYTFLDSIHGFRKAYHSVRQVAVEVTIPVDVLDKTMFDMPSDTTYQMLYTPQEFAFVDSVLKINFRTSNPYKYKPMVLYLVSMQKTNVKPGTLVIDNFITHIAKNSRYKLIGLDGKDSSDKMLRKKFSSLSLKDSGKFLIETIKKSSKNNNADFKNGVRLESEYKKQNLSALEQYQPYLETVNTKERNQLWMGKIPALIKQEATLIAVGVGHLIGEYGLINQLRKQGFVVKPVK